MNTVLRRCRECKEEMPLECFYLRSGKFDTERPSRRMSLCIECSKARSRAVKRPPVMTPYAKHEVHAIEYLHQNGIPAVPGKAIGFKDVDVVAYGCVPIEVKFSRLSTKGNREKFSFKSSARQQLRGYLADVVMLICEWSENQRTYHVFPIDFPAFFINGHLKKGFDYTPGYPARYRDERCVIMVDAMMDAAKDRLDLICNRFEEICGEVRRGDLKYQRYSRQTK